METQILIAEKLNFLQKSDAAGLLGLAAEVGRILNGLIASTKNIKTKTKTKT